MRLYAFVSKPSLQWSLAEKERSPGKWRKVENITEKQKNNIHPQEHRHLLNREKQKALYMALSAWQD